MNKIHIYSYKYDITLSNNIDRKKVLHKMAGHHYQIKTGAGGRLCRLNAVIS
jgi:hypothetical protein